MPSVLRLAGHGTALGRSLWFWCPGCDDAHRIVIDAPNGWAWDGNEASPTISPSILVTSPPDAALSRRCHSFVRSGAWESLVDCTHVLAGQIVPMVPLPDWLTDEYVG